ncbi:MAG: hypothetical protein WC629_01440 [Candidatus Paceibacterota bacterium]|jgi:hypothetical protein
MKPKGTPKEKYILMIELGERVKSEPTAFGKLLFIENEISCSIVATLHTIAVYVFNEEYKFKFDTTKDKLPELGKLIEILKPHIKQSIELKNSLEKFKGLRNDITHNMLSKYRNISELDTDSVLAVIWGDKVLKLLNDFRAQTRDVK